jgi:DNA-binding response OmpR family regulator
MKTITFNLSEQLETELDSKLERENITDAQYIFNLIENDLLRIDLGEGFYFHKQPNKLYDKENKEVQLTKIGKKLLLNLIESNGEIVSVDILMKKSWEKENVSIYTFRNMIKKIRDKTYYDLISNRSNLGYSVNIRAINK